jgi:hypothetical protein
MSAAAIPIPDSIRASVMYRRGIWWYSKHGTVIIRRIYGDWTDKGMSRWSEAANKHAFQTPHQLNYTTGKNATGTFMVIDAMDVLHSGHVDRFCIVSSDSDFTGLAKRARESGMFVMGMGKTTTPESFRKVCEVFTFVEFLSDRPRIVAVKGQRAACGAQDAADDLQAEPRRGPEPRPPDWKDVVFKAIEVTAQEEWGRLADMGNIIRKTDSSFDARVWKQDAAFSGHDRAGEVRGKGGKARWTPAGPLCEGRSGIAADLLAGLPICSNG